MTKPAPETMRLAHFALASLFMFSMVRAFAEPGPSPSRPSGFYPAATQDMASPADTQFPGQLDQARNRQFALPDSGNYESSGNSEQAVLAGDGRRQLRLTPEAR